MQRRLFLKSALAGGALVATPRIATAQSPRMTIKRVRFYHSPNPRPIFNQSTHVVEVETDQGIRGIGEGGTKETVEQCAGLLIGEDPSRIEHLWQLMYRGYFYPPAREKLHALGALDTALWDLKGKALGVPVHELLGGLTRDHMECYSTGFPWKGNFQETARACMEAGFRAFKTEVGDPDDQLTFNSRQSVEKTYRQCVEIREGVGSSGDWAIDFHTRLDRADAIRLAQLIEDLNPYFAEDLIRSENPGVYRGLRQQVRIPIAVGEHFGDRWEINELVEGRLIDYSRVSLPNCGGITEFVKLAALCETHYVGLIPHFTGPISTAALAHVCGTFSGPVLMEIVRAGPQEEPHLPRSYDFKSGKVWPNHRPGLGVEFDPSRAELVSEVTKRFQPVPLFRRPDGSITNW